MLLRNHMLPLALPDAGPQQFFGLPQPVLPQFLNRAKGRYGVSAQVLRSMRTQRAFGGRGSPRVLLGIAGVSRMGTVVAPRRLFPRALLRLSPGRRVRFPPPAAPPLPSPRPPHP